MAVLYFLLQIMLGLLVIIFGYFMWTFQYWKRRGIPYLEPKFPFGNLVPPHRRRVNLGLEVADLYRTARTKGWKYCGIFSLANPVLITVDLDFTKDIMNKYFHHFNERGIYYNEKDEPITAHLFAIGGTKWKNLRMKLTPTFTSGKMKTMFATLVACGATLEKFCDDGSSIKSSVDIKQVLVKYTTDIIGSCAFGINCNSFQDPNSTFVKKGSAMFRRTNWQNLKTILAMSFPDLARWLGVTLLPKEVSEFYTGVVKETVSYRKKNKVERPDFLQILIEILQEDEESAGDGKSLSIEEVVAQCFVFFIAGFETSSTTMTFALYELSKHPAIQEKVRQEIYTTLKRHNNQITYDAIKEMKYMEQVIDETLRKYPPVPLLTRKCSAEWKDPETGIQIERGTRIFIPVIGYHYDLEFWENPHEFDPDRFTYENKQKRHPYAHIPFGEGPRLCIGMRFGMMQTKVGMISILRNHRVILNNKTKEPLEFEKNTFIPTTKGGVWVDLEKI